MINYTIPRPEACLDLNFILAYISALLSGQYVLMKNSEVGFQVMTSITSFFTHCTRSHMTSTPKLWPIADWAMVLICLVLTASISSIARNIEVDKLYASMLFVAIFGSLGAGWVLGLTADLVVFGLLPFFLVSALLLVRLGQNLRGVRLHEEVEQEELREKA